MLSQILPFVHKARFPALLTPLAAAMLTVGCASRPPSLRSLSDLAYTPGNDSANILQMKIARAKKPVAVLFHTSGCGGCMMYTPTFYSVARDYADRAVFLDVNTGKHPGVRGPYNIRAVPTVIVFSKGTEVDRLVGTHFGSTLKTAIDYATQGRPHSSIQHPGPGFYGTFCQASDGPCADIDDVR